MKSVHHRSSLLSVAKIALTLSILLMLVFSPSANAWVNQGYRYTSTYVPFTFPSGTPSNVQSAWNSAATDWYNGNWHIQFTKVSSSYNVCSYIYMSEIEERGWMNPSSTSTTFQSFSAVINTYYSAGTNNVRYRSTANHEFGHVLGLGHTTGTSIMNGNRDLNTIYTPKADDITGVISIYGL